ncbi:MAG: surface lipoprotein assembly modifier [Proteobacteria bacterium]|nr:surface lipoprotein assembly modifier [Pseudomonadota bacterium]
MSWAAAVFFSPYAWSAQEEDPSRSIPDQKAEVLEDSSGNQPKENTPTERVLTPEEVLSIGKALLGLKRMDDAEKLFRSLLRSNASEDIRIEAAFQLGQTLVLRGRFREAALIYIDILNLKPDLPRVRLELALAYYLDKNYPDATFQFELVKGGDLPPEVIANVDAFLDRIRRQKDWTLDFSLSPVIDSNISQTSGDKEECIDVWGMTLCRPLDEKRSGVGLNINANLDYFKRFSQDWGLRASAGFSVLDFKGNAYDDRSLYAALGPRTLWASGEASLQPTFRKRWYAGKQYREEYGLRVDGRQIFGNLILDGTASYNANDYDNAYIHSVLNGSTWWGHLQPRYILNDRTFIQVGLDFVREKTRETAYSNDAWSYSLGLYRILPYGFSVFIQGSLAEVKYQAPQWYVTKDNGIDEAVRKDKIRALSISLSSNRLEKYGLTPIVRYGYTRRFSNIWSREFERNRLDFLMNFRI